MSEREIKVPDASHPIEVTPSAQRVRVYAGDVLVAESEGALDLDEQGYPVRPYLPLDAVDRSRVRESDTRTWCPYKGEASYLDVVTDDGVVADAGWYYPQAHDAVGEITGHVAWDPDKVRVEVG